MRYFPIVEIKLHHSTDGGPEWDTQNARIGGYKYINAAIKSIMKRARNGTVLNESRQTVALIQDGRVTWMME
jgi:hypothetical protein